MEKNGGGGRRKNSKWFSLVRNIRGIEKIDTSIVLPGAPAKSEYS